jgi:ribonucleoside-diphosphate reductase subunit M2
MTDHALAISSSAAAAAAATATPTLDPLLHDDEARLALFPIQYQDIYAMYRKQVDSFWRAEEINLSQDYREFQTLSQDEQYFVKMILAFFANSDLLVGQNLGQRFYNDIAIPEAKLFYGFQIAMEGIHSEVYSLLIETLVIDKEEKHRLFDAVKHFDFIRRKAAWAQKWINDKRTNFHTRLLAFICVEGIHFSGSFAAIYWLKKRGIMPGLTFSNELISRDEGLHTTFGVLIYTKLQKKLPQKKAHEIIREAADLEKDFMTDALPCRLIGMNADLMCQYIEFVSDRVCRQLGYDVIYGSKNPFDFMELISVETKSNFFERTVSEYALANKRKDQDIFSFDADF